MATKYWKRGEGSGGADFWDSQSDEVHYDNWFDDAECTVAATALPANGDAIVVAANSIFGPSSPPPNAPLTILGFTHPGGVEFPTAALVIAEGGSLSISGQGVWEGNAELAATATITDGTLGATGIVGSGATINGQSNVAGGTVGSGSTIGGSTLFSGIAGENVTFQDGASVMWGSIVGGWARFEDMSQIMAGATIGAGATFANSAEATPHQAGIIIAEPSYVETVARFDQAPEGSRFILLSRTASVMVGNTMTIDASALPADPVPAAPLMVIG